MWRGFVPSGLQDYPQQDLVFKQTPATPATPFTLSYDDGRVDSFDSDGNLVTRTDRFGNRTQLTWQSLGSKPVGAGFDCGWVWPDHDVHL
jgi:hypothetical protein